MTKGYTGEFYKLRTVLINITSNHRWTPCYNVTEQRN